MRIDPGSKTKRRKTMDKHGIVILADNPKKADEISAAFEKAVDLQFWEKLQTEKREWV